MTSAVSASSSDARFGKRNHSGGFNDCWTVRRRVGTAAPSTEATIAQ
jgi:hypothetical protein